VTDVLLPEFVPFPKISRRNRVIVITEKIDGTNGIVHVSESGVVTAGSRTRWITPAADNQGFAKFVESNADDLREKLGPGYHYGEWWGSGIQRRYGMTEKRFSLFNVGRWSEPSVRPACCSVVPVILTGLEKDGIVDVALNSLREKGSYAAPGFMKPEGIVIFHTASGQLQKVTLEKDEAPKGAA
jgi:hypothetical protein